MKNLPLMRKLRLTYWKWVAMQNWVHYVLSLWKILYPRRRVAIFSWTPPLSGLEVLQKVHAASSPNMTTVSTQSTAFRSNEQEANLMLSSKCPQFGPIPIFPPHHPHHLGSGNNNNRATSPRFIIRPEQNDTNSTRAEYIPLTLTSLEPILGHPQPRYLSAYVRNCNIHVVHGDLHSDSRGVDIYVLCHR